MATLKKPIKIEGKLDAPASSATKVVLSWELEGNDSTGVNGFNLVLTKKADRSITYSYTLSNITTGTALGGSDAPAFVDLDTAPTLTVDSGVYSIDFPTEATADPAQTVAENAATLEDDWYFKIQATTTTTGYENSRFGSETWWQADPTLVLTIGDNEYTLTRDSLQDIPSRYELPIEPDNPVVITFQDIQQFASDLGLTLPDLPGGATFSGTSISIYKLVVDIEDYVFRFDVAIDFNISIFSGLTINRVGLVLRRTDGTV